MLNIKKRKKKDQNTVFEYVKKLETLKIVKLFKNFDNYGIFF